MSIDIKCYVGTLDPTLPVPHLPWALDGTLAEEYFSRASGTSISITVDFDRINRDLIGVTTTGSEDLLTLHHALNILIGNRKDYSPRFDPNTIGLIFADRCKSFPGIYGLMFNAPFYVGDTTFQHTYRQGAAIFLSEIAEHIAAKDFLGQVMFDVVHELGHTFNLWHSKDHPPFFMTPSKSGSLYTSNAYSFSEEHIEFLSHWSLGETAKYVTPGLTPFGCRGGFSVPEDDIPQDCPEHPELQLTIHMAQEEFWPFEPVELDIWLEVTQPGRSISIPNEVDPSYDHFRIMITEPNGNKRLYQSPQICCGNNRDIHIRYGNPFARGFPLFGQAGGYTFTKQGRHQIQALFQIKNRNIHSNIVEVSVLGAAERDTFYRTASGVFQSEPIAESLYYHHIPFDDRHLLPAIEFAKSHLSTPAVAGFHYALGRGLLNRAVDRKRHVNSTKDRQAGLEYLYRALDSNKLVGHKARVAEQITRQPNA